MSRSEMAMTHEQINTKKEQIFCRKVRHRKQKRSRNQVAEQIYRSRGRGEGETEKLLTVKEGKKKEKMEGVVLSSSTPNLNGVLYSS